MTELNNLITIKNTLENLLLYLKVSKTHKEKEIRLQNPHCPRYKQCQSEDCFLCENNIKGSEQYVLEKIVKEIIKEEGRGE